MLFESGNFRDAAFEYERTAYAYPFHDSGGEAGYAALLAYTKHEAELRGNERAEWHRRSIDSSLRFAESYSAHAQAATVQTDAAEKLFALGEFGRARDVGRQVVARTPPVDATLQRTAWTVVAHSEFDLAEFAAAETAYVQLLGAVPSGDPQRSEITERIASSIYKQGEQARSTGRARGRSRAFPARGAGRAVLARACDGRVRCGRRAHPDGRLAACDHRARELPERHSRIMSWPPT